MRFLMRKEPMITAAKELVLFVKLLTEKKREMNSWESLQVISLFLIGIVLPSPILISK